MQVAGKILIAGLLLAAVPAGMAQEADAEEEDVAELGTYQVGQGRTRFDFDTGEKPELKADRPAIRMQPMAVPKIRLELGSPGGTGEGSAQEPVPLSTPAPEYPRSAAELGLEGRVTVAFTIGESGETQDIEVVEASPRGVFDEAARRAVAGWSYEPYRVNGEPRAKRVQQTINFNLKEGDVPRAPAAGGGETRDPVALSVEPPRYPRQAAMRHQEGYVVIEFTITAAGETEDIEVIRSQPIRVFDDAARRAVADWKFRPALENGQPVPRRVQQTLNFNL